MARYYGKVGYGLPEEKSPGVYEDAIKEIAYFGDVVRDTFKWRDIGRVHEGIDVAMSIRIIADPFAFEHISAMRYVEWAGDLWKITDVEVQRPRLILRVGGVYVGPTPEVTDDPGGSEERG